MTALFRLAGRKEVIEAVAIAAFTALATKAVDLVYDRIKKRLEKDDKKPQPIEGAAVS